MSPGTLDRWARDPEVARLREELDEAIAFAFCHLELHSSNYDTNQILWKCGQPREYLDGKTVGAREFTTLCLITAEWYLRIFVEEHTEANPVDWDWYERCENNVLRLREWYEDRLEALLSYIEEHDCKPLLSVANKDFEVQTKKVSAQESKIGLYLFGIAAVVLAMLAIGAFRPGEFGRSNSGSSSGTYGNTPNRPAISPRGSDVLVSPSYGDSGGPQRRRHIRSAPDGIKENNYSHDPNLFEKNYGMSQEEARQRLNSK